MKTNNITITIIGGAIGGFITLIYEWHVTNVIDWKFFIATSYGIFLGIIVTEILVFLITQAKSDGDQRRRLLWGILGGALLSVPLLWNEWEALKMLVVLLSFSVLIAIMLLVNRTREKISDKTLFLSMIAGGLAAFVIVKFFGVSSDNYELLMCVGVCVGAIIAKDLDFFFS